MQTSQQQQHCEERKQSMETQFSGPFSVKQPLPPRGFLSLLQAKLWLQSLETSLGWLQRWASAVAKAAAVLPAMIEPHEGQLLVAV